MLFAIPEIHSLDAHLAGMRFVLVRHRPKMSQQLRGGGFEHSADILWVIAWLGIAAHQGREAVPAKNACFPIRRAGLGGLGLTAGARAEV